MQYIAIFCGCKNGNFQMTKCDNFLIFAQNIDHGYSLELLHWGGSNEYPQSLFYSKNKKIMYTPLNPFFIAPAYSKVRCRGSTFHPFVRSFRHSFVCSSVRPSVNNSCQGALLCSSDSWEYETLYSYYPWHTLQAGTLTQCSWPSFHAPLTLSKFCVV